LKFNFSAKIARNQLQNRENQSFLPNIRSHTPNGCFYTRNDFLGVNADLFEIPLFVTYDGFRQYTDFQYHYVKSVMAESLHITAQRITLGIEECTTTPCALKGQHKITNKMGLPLDKRDFTTYICALKIIYVSIIIKIVRSHYLPC